MELQHDEYLSLKRHAAESVRGRPLFYVVSSIVLYAMIKLNGANATVSNPLKELKSTLIESLMKLGNKVISFNCFPSASRHTRS